MHVAYLVNQYPKISHTFIRREINALEALGIQVSRFAFRTDGTESIDPQDAAEARQTHYVLQAGMPRIALACLSMLARPLRLARALAAAVRIGRHSDQGIIRHFIYLAEACLLVQWIARSGATHLHAHFATNSTTVALLYRYLGGVPFSFTIHGPEEFDSPRALALNEKIRAAKFVVAISSFCRSQVYRWADFGDWAKVHVVRCALDFAEYGGISPPPASAQLLCVGRLSPEKGQLLLLGALHSLSARGLRPQLVLAGDGPLRPRIEQMIGELGLQSQVRITGWIDGRQVHRELAAARCLVTPSFAEGLPVVIMEAMAMGRPVLSSTIAGIPELVIDDVTGWLFPAGDAAQLAAGIEKVLGADSDRLSEMGRQGRARVQRMHDSRHEAQRLASLFQDDGMMTTAKQADR